MENFWEHLRHLTRAQEIIEHGGLYLLLVVVFAETGLFFGFFLPGDYLLVLAGIFCANGMLHTSVYFLIVSLVMAGFLGNYVGYWFGYRTGDVLFTRNDSWFFKKRYVRTAEEFYTKHGGKALIIGRFLPIIRTFAPIFAGIVRVDFKRFTFYNLIGSIAWVTILTLTGYFLGRKYPDQIQDYLQYIVIGLIIVTTIPLIVALVRKRLTNSNIDDNTHTEINK
ncbi:alkaline phosphatase [Mucilaginibacter sp. PPCGB 2223]|uniref:DedA family protein n=1 Tax=Mucilaginibacter sp. PPCGB 2223 TaxID=1886027 RepID=UPI0008243BF8|nr:DedA family protein [Mucilaginibacter sp. PPCGB 2223]OCX50604.1 alkaline phosphatase [Mucilaginibacter sp. PPCGB 2223]